jgi:hypothetical protein
MATTAKRQFYYRFLEIKDGFYFNNEALGGLLGYVLIDSARKNIALKPLSALFPDRGLVNIVGLNDIYSRGIIFNGDPTLVINTIPHTAVPIGTIIMYAGNTEPNGWFFCNGKSIPRSQFSKLFNVIGTRYSSQTIINGNTLFTLPDLRHRLVKGFDATQAAYSTLGNTGGKIRHTLTLNQLPDHSHSGTLTVVGIGHSHNYLRGGNSGIVANSPYGGARAYNFGTPTVTSGSATADAASSTHTHSVVTKTAAVYSNTITNPAAPGVAADNRTFSIIQPSLYMSFIIKY